MQKYKKEITAAPEVMEHGRLRKAMQNILHGLTTQLFPQPIGNTDHDRCACDVYRNGYRQRKQNAAGGIEQATIQKDAQAFYREQSS